jgi:hypothetical protein
MNSGRIALGFLITAVIAIFLLFGATSVMITYADTNKNASTTSQVIVNGLVSVTLSGVPIYFSAMDPGTNKQLANATGGAPMSVQVDGTTNVATQVYLNASAFDSSGNTLAAGMMNYNVTLSATSVNNTLCASTPAPCNYTTTVATVFNETARLGTPATTSVYNWVTVPSDQVPGTYANAVRVCAEQKGVGGC